MIAFKIVDEGEKPPLTYQEIIFHTIVYIKMEDFLKKARYGAGFHASFAPHTLAYASVLSRESVRIALTFSVLNDIEVKISDIQNVYLNAPCLEKMWTTLGSEFDPGLIGKKALVFRALYGLKYIGASFRNHLAEYMRNIGYSSCLADPYLWFNKKNTSV